MSVTIAGISAGSPADKAGIASGDILRRIDGNDIEDVLDYRFYMTSSRLELELSRQGTTYTKSIKKPEYDDLGLLFDTYLMDNQRPCKNKCIFCFIDQLPKGLRESLYFKDDDSRMSFLFGNYITLTNLRERDVQRILSMHISPVNISVHTTNPELRVKMMANPHSGEVLDYIPRLAKGGIKINAQLVLCAGINDGAELERTLTDLCALAPKVQSVAVVPLGMTRYRDGLAELRMFEPAEARQVLQIVDHFGQRMQREHNQRICYAADEFYLCAGLPIPSPAYYGEYPQLENGVGMLALLQDEFAQALKLEDPHPTTRKVTIATGTAAAPFLEDLSQKAMAQFPGLQCQVTPIRNDFFGETITVAGLVTGGDLISQLQPLKSTLGEALLIPSAMLRHEGDLFLDNVSLPQLTEALGIPVRTVPNDGFELLDAMLGVASATGCASGGS